MQLNELIEKLEVLGYPIAYDHFEEPPNSIPYIAITDEEPIQWMADNIVYASIPKYSVELYTILKEPKIEEKVEKAFEQCFTKHGSIYIEKEEMYVTTYTI